MIGYKQNESGTNMRVTRLSLCEHEPYRVLPEYAVLIEHTTDSRIICVRKIPARESGFL